MLAEGHVLDQTYRIARLIGEGGMGAVYEATHARLAGRYAVKVLLQSLSNNPDALAHFHREAKITSTLQHPNIVQVVDFNRAADGVEYMVMEYLQGETLSNRLARLGPLPPPAVAEIIEQVGAALTAAHAHGIVHRDLKPDNVFLVAVEGRAMQLVKVLDFGISKMRDAGRRVDGPVSALMGTPQYMSPEQCQGRTAEVDAASDQFALAAITYEMLTGRPPFSGASLGAVLSRVLYEDAAAMGKGIGLDIERVVCRGLAKAKDDRFRSVTAFVDAFTNAVAHGPNRFPTFARKWGAPLVAAGVFAACAAFLLGKRPWQGQLVTPRAVAASGPSAPSPTARVSGNLPQHWQLWFRTAGAGSSSVQAKADTHEDYPENFVAHVEDPPSAIDSTAKTLASRAIVEPPRASPGPPSNEYNDTLARPDADAASTDMVGQRQPRPRELEHAPRRARAHAGAVGRSTIVPAAQVGPSPEDDDEALMPLDEHFGEQQSSSIDRP